MVTKEHDRCFRFQSGLREDVRVLLISQRIKNYNELLETAKLIENDGDNSQRRIEFQKKRLPEGQCMDFSRRSGDLNWKRKRGGPPMKTRTESRANSNTMMPLCPKCGKTHFGECLKGAGVCFKCQRPGHRRQDCPLWKSISERNTRTVPSQASTLHYLDVSSTIDKGDKGKGIEASGSVVETREERQVQPRVFNMNQQGAKADDTVITAIKELQNVPFIPVANGTRFVRAKSLLVHLTINLSPFAFELPSIYLQFVKILKEIGVQEILSVDYVRDLILSIRKSSGYQRLNPNELRAVREILNFICSESTKSNSGASELVFESIVPNEDCRLVSANVCVYVDSHGSQFLDRINTSQITFCHPELPENICINLGIKKLSDVVIEKLDESQLQVVDQIASVPLNKIKNKLLSKELQHSLWRLIYYMKIHSPALECLNLEQLERSLSQVAFKLQFVRSLHTQFLLLPKNMDITRISKDFAIPEWDWSSRHRTIHFMDKSRNRILVAEPPSYISIYDVVSIVVSQILEAPTILPIGPLLSCPDGSEKAVLNAMKIGFETGIVKEVKNNMLAGRELLPQDALQVQLLPMRPFYKGEIVAWMPGREGEKLRYGIVSEDVRPSSGEAIHKIPLEIVPGEHRALLSTQVFSFKSISMGNISSLSSLLESSAAASETGLLTVQKNKEAGNGKVEQQAARELQYGKVSAEETVRAVHDMLWAAGISMDAEQQTLLQTTLTLQEQVNEFQVALLAEQEKADTVAKEAVEAKAAWSCRVCLSTEVDTAIVPCGHVMCHKCSPSVHRCPFCRSIVSTKLKIFRP